MASLWSTRCLHPGKSWYWAGGTATDTEKLRRKREGQKKEREPGDAGKGMNLKNEKDGAWRGLGAKGKNYRENGQ